MTSGNHIWDKREALEYIELEPRLIRPANYPPGAPGKGHVVVTTKSGISVGVINVMGRVFMAPLDNPFTVVQEAVAAARESARIIFVDFHAEVTSEKNALGWHLDGRVSAVVGTHTHIPTADERVLPCGTAYITDVGMTGPYESVIGMKRKASIHRFIYATPSYFEPATGDVRFSGVVINVDEKTGNAQSIQRLSVGRP
mgnify:CR=1 FL=1